VIRREDASGSAELSAIRAVNEAAFGRLDEADLIDNLRTEDAVLVSLVTDFTAWNPE
jgi:predicted N-acetyltransferase YhbS